MDAQKSNRNENSQEMKSLFRRGLPMGIAVGTAIGVALSSIPIGIALGIGLSFAFGAAQREEQESAGNDEK